MRASTKLIFVLCFASMAGIGKDKNATFEGNIMDKQCAQMGSHDDMMKAEGANNAKECALKCTKNGDKFALLDTKTKKVLIIEDEKKVKEFAGEHVKITGSYDDDSGVLNVKTISAAQ